MAIEIVQEYKYLGIIFKPSGVFSHAIKYLYNKALKATFCVRRALKAESINTELYLTIYEHCVKPILLYCSEIWSIDFLINKAGQTEIAQRYDLLLPEKLQLRFLKSVMGVHKYANNNAVRSEFGIFALAIYGLKNSLNYWIHLVNSKDITFAVKSYKDSMAFFRGFASKFKVFMHIIDFDHVWINQCTFSKNRLIHSVFNKLKDSYSQYWKTCLFDDSKNAVNGNKLRTYRTFKVDYEREMYLLINDLPKTHISSFAKFRISAHSLETEKDRHKKLLLTERICPLCKSCVETEIHFLLHCQPLSEHRNNFYKELEEITPIFNSMSDNDKFCYILQNREYDVLCICISHVHKMFVARDIILSNRQ